MRRFFHFVLALVICLLAFCVPAAAAEPEVEVEEALEDGTVGDYSVSVELPEYTEDNPLPVQIVPDDDESFPDYDNSGIDTNSLLPDVDSSEPDSPLFTGCWFVTGYDSRLGTITIYIPAEVDPSYFGIDSDGYLVYVGRTAISGYLDDVRNNNVSFTSFGTGRYSRLSGSSYDSYDLHLVPTSTNLQIWDSMRSIYDVSDYLPYFVLLLGGALLVCFMRR